MAPPVSMSQVGSAFTEITMQMTSDQPKVLFNQQIFHLSRQGAAQLRPVPRRVFHANAGRIICRRLKCSLSDADALEKLMAH